MSQIRKAAEMALKAIEKDKEDYPHASIPNADKVIRKLRKALSKDEELFTSKQVVEAIEAVLMSVKEKTA